MPGYPISSASNTAPTIVDLDSGRRKFNSPVTAVRSCPEARPATGHGAVFVQTSIQRADRPPDHPARRSRAPSRQAGRYYASFHFWGKIPVDRSAPCQIIKSSAAGVVHAPASIGKHLQHCRCAETWCLRQPTYPIARLPCSAARSATQFWARCPMRYSPKRRSGSSSHNRMFMRWPPDIFRCYLMARLMNGHFMQLA